MFSVWQIVDGGTDHCDRAGVQFLWLGAQLGMARHIIHLPVHAGRQPGLQVGNGGAGFGAADAHFGKTQGFPQFANAQLERSAIKQGVLIMHAPHLTADFAAASAVASARLLIDLPDEAATQRLGAALAQTVQPGLVIFLEGDLGAGKTTRARALIRALGYGGPVKSPTYALVELYVISSLYLYHFDFYRFESAEEFLDAGFDEYFNAASVCLVEWPDKAAGCVPSPDLRISLQHAGEGRRIEFVACSERGASCVRQLNIPGASSCAAPAPH